MKIIIMGISCCNVHGASCYSLTVHDWREMQLNYSFPEVLLRNILCISKQ